jgi:hypothetical protein
MSMKNSNETIGNRTRDLPASSAVPQPTAPPRVFKLKVITTFLLCFVVSFMSILIYVFIFFILIFVLVLFIVCFLSASLHLIDAFLSPQPLSVTF